MALLAATDGLRVELHALRQPYLQSQCSALGLPKDADGLIDHEVFESITTAGKLVVLASWRDVDAAEAWTPAKPDSAKSIRHRRVRVIRDYGMFERREAPQYYPDIGSADAQAGTADADDRRKHAPAR